MLYQIRTRVPKITLIFWIIKIAATTLGDAVSTTMKLGYLESTAIFAVLCLVQIAGFIVACIAVLPRRAGGTRGRGRFREPGAGQRDWQTMPIMVVVMPTKMKAP